jgi:PKD repeat protein
MGSVDRTVAHMLSGKSLGGGIAYVGVLCNRNWGYGVSASLGGNFDINNPAVVWDLLVVSHEIGHNFSSSHTQEYCGIGGISEPVDLCYKSSSSPSCGSAIGLPGPGTLSGGSTSQRPGTIMSYCHLVGGGYSNITFTFGKNHLYGVAADRVPDRMYGHVLSSAASYPGCLDLAGTTQNIAPSADFTFNTADLTATFTDASGDSDGSVDSWSWDFGDGATASTQNPSHTYDATGDYEVTLTVTDDAGATDSATQTVTVSAPAGPQSPAAPSNLVATVEKTGRGKTKVVTGVTLSWTDNSDNETGFIVESCKEETTGKGKNRSVTCTYSETASTGENTTTFSVDPIGDDDHFRVKAVNDLGSSDYTNEVKI